MNSKTISILLFILSTAGLNKLSAQIKGRVIESNGIPLNGVNCKLSVTEKDSIIQQSVTNENGLLSLTPPNKGYYVLTLSMIGYNTKKIDSIQYNGQVITLDPILLSSMDNRIQEIEINHERPTSRQDLDKLTIDVSKSIAASGGNVLDILSRAPGVVLDQQNSTIKLRGKEGVLILINNRQTYLPQAELLQMLKGINNGIVSKIDVITSPSADMDASGAGGVINITLKEGKGLGKNISFGINSGYGRKGKLGGDFNFSNNYGRLGFTVSYSSNFNETREDWQVDRTNYFESNLFSQKTKTNREASYLANTGTVAVNYTFNDRLTLSSNMQLFLKHWDMLAKNTAVASTGININQIDDEKDRWTNLLSGLNAKYIIDSKSNFQIGIDYLRYQNKNQHTYNSVYFSKDIKDSVENIKIDKRTPINIKVFKADYENNLNNNLILSAGIKGALSSFKNTVVDKDIDNNKESSLVDLNGEDVLRENIYAIYSNLKYQINQHIKLNAGMRYEYTTSNLLDNNNVYKFDKKYGNLFPNLSIESKIGTGVAQLGYQRRILRPSFVDLAPFVVFLDPYTYVTGNSQLNPTITDNYSLQYKLSNYLLSLEYSKNKNAINSFQPILDDKLNTLLLTPINIDNVKTYNFSISVPLKPYRWWELMFSGNLFHHKASIDNDLSGILKIQQNSYRINMQNTFKLPKNYALELSGYYQNTFIVGITKREIPAEVNFGISKKINERSSINVVANDIFKTNIWKEKNDFSNPFLVLNRRNNFETRIIRVSLRTKLVLQKRKTVRN
ncbi:TonB-dependent receptor [Sphingobacterium sp. KU25419]|nr:TonB-dependent receptor [Sphingobacterium sp. KU25419]